MGLIRSGNTELPPTSDDLNWTLLHAIENLHEFKIDGGGSSGVYICN